MKVLYSQLKKYIPELNQSPEEIGEVFTFTGFLLDGPAEIVQYEGKEDYLFDLEVRQNRGDLQGAMNLAIDLAAYFGLETKLPDRQLNNENDYELPIEIKAKDVVKRVVAIKLDSIEVSESPEWLKDYLALYDINSVNNIVDLTNYVMLETAHSSHAFDTKLTATDRLVWDIDPNKYKKMTTLAEDEVELGEETLVIGDGKEAFSLGIIGGQKVGINQDTKEIVLEMAVYDPGLIRRNARDLNIHTEAGNRLQKHLDPDSIDMAFDWLVNLLIENAGAKIASKKFDYYPEPTEKLEIEIDLEKCEQIAGVEIDREKALKDLERLGFQVSKNPDSVGQQALADLQNTTDRLKTKLTVTRPTNRLDILEENDVYEEIIRMHGFEKLPKDQLSLEVTRNVTPEIVNLVDKVKMTLQDSGFDEVRSSALVSEQMNKLGNPNRGTQAVETENSINEEIPFLRQSIASGLLKQLETMQKNFISDIRIFEIGKVFNRINGDSVELKSTEIKHIPGLEEHYSLGLLIDTKNLDELREQALGLLNSLGIEDVDIVELKDQERKPEAAHPKTTFEITVKSDNQKISIGQIYLTNKTKTPECCVVELNLDQLTDILSKIKSNATQEILGKLVALDANIVLDEKDGTIEERVRGILGANENLWSFEVIDKFEDDGSTKYTVRITYMHLSDTEAKEMHKELFGE